MRDDSPHLKGNERYSGFVVDLLEKLSRLLKFQYYIKEVEDNQYGVFNESTGSYSGLIGEILLGVSFPADLLLGFQEIVPWSRHALSLLSSDEESESMHGLRCAHSTAF